MAQIFFMTRIFFIADLFLDNSNKLNILHHKNITLVRSSKAGPPTPLALKVPTYTEEPRTPDKITDQALMLN
jgi:hypothetical protein